MLPVAPTKLPRKKKKTLKSPEPEVANDVVEMAKHCQVQSYPDYSPESFLENLNTTLDESATEWEAADALILSKSESERVFENNGRVHCYCQ